MPSGRCRPRLATLADDNRTLRLSVSGWFQALFHSPPGVLFTFPLRYSSLSVSCEYLALEGGPPRFTPDFRSPALLSLAFSVAFPFAYGTITLCGRSFQWLYKPFG